MRAPPPAAGIVEAGLSYLAYLGALAAAAFWIARRRFARRVFD